MVYDVKTANSTDNRLFEYNNTFYDMNVSAFELQALNILQKVCIFISKMNVNVNINANERNSVSH